MTYYNDLPANKKYDFFVQSLTDVIQNHTPKKSMILKNHRNSTFWWVEECNEVKRKTAFKQWVYRGNRG